jgi:hypothetical protein
MSSPVTSSVTGCSTCSRGLTSRNQCSVARDQELHRAHAAVAQPLRQAHGVGQHLLAQPWRQRRGGRFLDQLLVPPLQRALALEQVDDAALPVAGDLHLDVAAAAT